MLCNLIQSFQPPFNLQLETMKKPNVLEGSVPNRENAPYIYTKVITFTFHVVYILGFTYT